MAFDRKKSQSRVEPTFVFDVNQSRDAKASHDGQECDETGLPYTIPAFLRKGKTGMRADKMPFTGFKPAAKDDPKTKVRRPQSAKTNKANATNKTTASAKPTTTGWFDSDFARIAKTAQPKHMTEMSGEPTEPDFSSRPAPSPRGKEKPSDTAVSDLAMSKPESVRTAEPGGLPNQEVKEEPIPEPPKPHEHDARASVFLSEETIAAAPVKPAEPALQQPTHAAAFETTFGAKPKSERQDEKSDDFFISKVIKNEDDDDDDDDDDPADWHPRSSFANRRPKTPSSSEIHVPYEKQRVGHRSSIKIISNLLSITAAGFVLFVATGFWPAIRTNETTTRQIANDEVAAPTHQRDMSPQAIVASGADKGLETQEQDERAKADAQTTIPALPQSKAATKVPLPNGRPASIPPTPDSTATKRAASNEPWPPRHVVLAPGPHLLVFPSSANRLKAPNYASMPQLSSLTIFVQRKLSGLGYANVPQTGEIDAATRRAIRAFQLNSGLPLTGKMDDRTLDLLKMM